METVPSPLVDALLRPGAFPGCAGAAELVETHISWVLLAGPFAYKIKKPVDFGLVDFSTLERRRAFCDEELRLNRRLAPQLYLGVVPLTGSPAAPRISGDGPPLEFAVKMRRFRREDELASMAARGVLRAGQVEALARAVAAFHADADAAPPDPAWGGPEDVLGHWLGNFTVLRRTGLAAADGDRLEALEAWTRSRHAQLAPLIEARRCAGFVRECHGDLHLGNVVMVDGHPLPFDALEFDPALRWTDVIAEIAFTMMDLERHGCPELSRRFLDAWLECTGDYAGLALLVPMLVYRALVRAKVAALRASQAGAGAQREASLGEMRAQIALAEHLRTPRPRVLAITSGVSGSGKSRLALGLAEHGDWIRIRSDVERKRMAGMGATDRAPRAPDTGLYAPGRTADVYERLASLARQVVLAGHPVLVDATFLKRRQRDAFRAVASACDAGFAVLAVEAPPTVLEQRVRERAAEGRDPSDATLEVLRQQLRTREPLGADELACALAVDTQAPADPGTVSQALLRRALPHPDDTDTERT